MLRVVTAWEQGLGPFFLVWSGVSCHGIHHRRPPWFDPGSGGGLPLWASHLTFPTAGHDSSWLASRYPVSAYLPAYTSKLVDVQVLNQPCISRISLTRSPYPFCVELDLVHQDIVRASLSVFMAEAAYNFPFLQCPFPALGSGLY